MASLMNGDTGDEIREATAEEEHASDEAAKIDGGAGAILVEIDGKTITCYTEATGTPPRGQ